MNFSKYTRRKFLRNTCLLTAVSGSLSSFLPSSSMGIPKEAQKQFQELTDRNKIKELLKQKTPANWVFTGDSITQGAKHTHGNRSYPEVFSERLRWEMRRSRDQIINTGISGNTTRNILEDFDWRIKQFSPSVVSLMIGTNDCAEGRNINLKLFNENLDSLITGIRALGAIPILHTPNLIIKEKAPERSNLSEYVDVIKRVAEDKKIILVDNWGYWKQAIAKTSQAKIFNEWLNDPLHPNGVGHLEIARLMFKELAIFNSNDPTCGGLYYEGEH